MGSPRNESARARRREKLKEQLSLTSVPRSEMGCEGGAPRQHYTLDNHFGWKVLYKTQVGDGTFPHLTQYLEKPNILGREFQKVTYVLYMDKGTVVNKETALKQTQTTVSGILVSSVRITHDESKDKPSSTVSRATLLPELEKRMSEITKSDKKPKKLISEFYYVPRDRSRSAKRVKSKEKFKAGDSDMEDDLKKKTQYSSKSQISEVENMTDLDEVTQEIEKEKEAIKEKSKKEVEKKRGKKHDRWNLRAGAENCESKSAMIEGKVSGIVKTESKLIHKLRFDLPSEHLLESKSGTNKYLYVARDRRQNSNRRTDRGLETCKQT